MGATGPKPRGQDAGHHAHAGPAAAKASPKLAVAGGRRSYRFRSDFASSRDVQVEIMQDVLDCGFDDETTFAIRISLEEAIVNAIRHGNRMDASKTVTVESDVRPGRAEITVEDEGAGFERAHIADPTAEENLCRPNGRGILLIESYMTHARWDHGGRRVYMVKEADPVPAATARQQQA